MYFEKYIYEEDKERPAFPMELATQKPRHYLKT
jgi:hypothetical protein